MRAIPVLVLLAACQTQTDNHDVAGPFTGPSRRFVVDRFTMPATPSAAKQLGDDLDGDGRFDNALGGDIALIVEENDGPVAIADMIAAGSLASSLVIQSDDPLDDPTAAVAYVGADGELTTPVGGTLVAGTFRSNRTATTDLPGTAIVHLPVFADAAISVLELDEMEIDLAPDGAGGLDAVLRGGVPPEQLGTLVVQEINQMIAFDPAGHRLLARLEDQNRDGVIDLFEIDAFIAPDVTLHGRRLTSLGFGVHLVPCETGSCQAAPPIDRCHDRVRDANESDVDCGGPCAPCVGGAICAVDADCQTGACTGHVCTAATCNDGRKDGLESDVDCGWNCGPCAVGQHCFDQDDCGDGGVCADHTGDYGVCMPY